MKTYIKQLRQNAGYKSAREFATSHGFPTATYNRYENGYEPPLGAAIKLADIFDVSLDKLVFGEEKISIETSALKGLLEIGKYWDNMSDTSKEYLLTIAKALSQKDGDSNA